MHIIHPYSPLIRRAFIDVNSMIEYGSGILAMDATLWVDSVVILCLYTMLPRFIISIRELYDRQCHRHCQGIDTGFGVLSQLATDEDQVVSAIAFADAIQGQSEDQALEGHVCELESIPSGVVGGDETSGLSKDAV